MRFQPIYDIAEVCARKGINQAILCPGSRCAPLTLAFTRHPKINTRTFSDERSAAFVALGVSQASSFVPPVLICTSGSAVYNFAPAVAEAYFSNTPLIVITADRPKEWIGQHDGQTVFQQGIYGQHVKRSYQLPQDYDHPDSQWEINRVVNEAINLASAEPKGPVHINAPFREPLYPTENEQLVFSDHVRVTKELTSDIDLSDKTKIELMDEWTQSNKILVVAGQHLQSSLVESMSRFMETHDVPVVGDVLSNLHSLEKVVRHSEAFLGQAPDKIRESLKPDLLITFGQSIISKSLKLYLRQAKIARHWHIQPAGDVADTYQSVTRVVRTTPQTFFDFVCSVDKLKGFESQKQSNYQKLWEVEERRVARALSDYFPRKDFNELELVNEVLSGLPVDSSVHLSNSMSVRYANLVGISSLKENITVYSNRGTSGIDGCTSTAVGHALSSDKPQFLITGDMAFFYDRNAFWHNYKLPNLRIVVLNNHGGIIFKMIDGPADLPESDEYFVTQQQLTAAHLCAEFDFDHLRIKNQKQVRNVLKDFFDFDGRTKVLELETSIELNRQVLNELKTKIRDSYEL